MELFKSKLKATLYPAALLVFGPPPSPPAADEYDLTEWQRDIRNLRRLIVRDAYQNRVTQWMREQGVQLPEAWAEDFIKWCDKQCQY